MLPFLAFAVVDPSPTDLDFWVGKWEMASHSRKNPTSEEFTDGIAHNDVIRKWDGKAIEENFSNGAYKGQSWSVFNPTTKVWHQTWIDNGGAYLLFEGGKEGDKFVLNLKNGGPKVQMRMVFSNIQKDSFVWDWEQSSDEGKSWLLMWELKYKRK